MSALDGRVALVTGGTSGIGKEAVGALRRRGARVVFCGRDPDRGRTVAESGEDTRFVAADVGEEDDVDRLVSTTLEAFGRLDLVLNNAGYEGATAPLADYPVETFDRVLRTNLRGPFLVLKKSLPHLLESDGGGTVVNVSSFVGTVVPVPIASAYGASKAGVLSLTATTAAAYGEAGLRVFSVAPWITDTPMVTERVSGGDPAVLEQLVSLNPSGSIAQPEDVADVALRLFEDPGSAPNGSALMVDRGGETSAMAFPVPPGGEA